MTEGPYFYDYDPMGFPKDTQHFFNILVICVAVPPEEASEIFPEGVTDIWYLDELTEPRPRAFHFYLDDNDEEEDDDCYYGEDCWDEEEDDYYYDSIFQITYYPHSVVEIYNGIEVCFYSMIDFETQDFWEID